MPYNGIKAREARQKLIDAMFEAQGKPFEADDPLRGKYGVTSPYGPRIHPITGKPSFHTGTDRGAPAGTPVYASADGYVSAAMLNDPIGGNQIYIQHPGGQQTRYLHLSRFADRGMKAGPVKRGELIGYVGSTGRSTGPHLHYGVYDKGSARDPSKYATGRQPETQVAALGPSPVTRQRPVPSPGQQPRVSQVKQSQPRPALQMAAYQAPRLSEDEITRNLNLQQLALARLPRDLLASGVG